MVEQVPGSSTGASADEVADQRDSERRILLAAVELIDQFGETGLRISDLVGVSGRSVGSIYHFYDNREGVIEAVRAYRFYPSWDEDLARFREASSAASTLDEWLDSLGVVLGFYFTAARNEFVWRRIESIAAARTRPSLRMVLAERQREQTEAFEGMLRDLQQRGIVRNDLEVHSTAIFMQAFTLGRILSILEDTEHLAKDDWITTARLAMGGVLRG